MFKILRVLLFLLFLFIFYNFSHSQNIINKDFLIITYEKSTKYDYDKIYSWIIPLDSINNTKEKISPVYLVGYSKTLLKKCQNGDTVSPFDSFKSDKFDFNESYLEMQNEVFDAIEVNKKKILSVKKKFFDMKYKEEIIVYITPIRGRFCKCPISLSNGNKINYTGEIYLPVMDIIPIENFDYSDLDFYLLHKKMDFNKISNVPF
ncbi:MAG: hypothetical protein LAT51_04395 [Flavobacteriaceae bacterium]|nr:hypothetical protein [Flavobacteriaceae bacterium]